MRNYKDQPRNLTNKTPLAVAPAFFQNKTKKTMTTKTFLLLILVAVVVVYTVTTTVLGAYCHGEPKNKERNLNMILSQEPVFVRSVTNGKLFVVNQGTQYEMPIVHVYGTPYEQGYANGLLTKEKLLIFVPKVSFCVGFQF
jgi:hypothetical protein